MSGLTALVLAAGLGKRMKSRLPKILHPAAGRPLVHYPIRAAFAAGAERVVVVTSPDCKELIDAHTRVAFESGTVTSVVQHPPRGTGDAARVGLEALGSSASRVLVLCGDTPLLDPEDLKRVLVALGADGVALAMLSCDLDDPRGYGRVLRDAHGRVAEIREDRDLEPEARLREKEVNAGVYAMSAEVLRNGIATLGTNNAQGEYYLTDIVAFGARTARVVAIKGSPDALVGVNDRVQLAEAEELLVRRIADRHRLAGVTVRAGARIDDTVEIGQDARIEAGVELRGKTSVGGGATVDTGCVVTDSSIGEGAVVLPYSVMNESAVGARTQIGPFARLRPGSVIEDEAHVGNFVETKKTRLRRGAKANHLSYLGDGDIGERANIGAGTIFCNYDGFTKQKTVIGEGAFVGSDSQLVAPVTVGKGAYVATGTTVTRDVPDDALALSRVKQENKEGYASRLKARLAAKKGKP
jgi:bifunctional UDP-N-acetylglucosamine pyrophosphorylase / glucosamine-1-phosphate N-acetyltransferase